MKIIENVHTAVVNCCSLTSGKAAFTGTWSNHTVQSFGAEAMNGPKALGSGIWHLMQKCAHAGKAALSGISSGVSTSASCGWQVMQYARAKGWEIARIGGAYGTQLLSKIASLACSILGFAATTIATGWSILKHVAVKIALFSAEKIAQFGGFLKGVLNALAAGAYRGFQSARVFAVGHPVELALFGAALAIFSLGYATAYYRHSETGNA